MYRRIVARSFGGPEVLRVETATSPPEPGAGEARVRVEAAGVGYTDTIVRRGRYIGYKGGLPLTPGYDVVGTVDALGPGVTGPAPGTRVADMPIAGAYGQYLVRPAAGLVPVPDGVPPELAIEVPLMWVTAWQMLTRVVTLSPGQTILVVGAGGSVGRALVVLGRHLGLKVVGTCSARSIAEVEAAGAVAIDHRRPRLARAVRDASDGGVAAAFDAVGGASWAKSYRALARGGTLVAYGLSDFVDSGRGSYVAVLQFVRLKLWNRLGGFDGTGRRTVFYDIQAWRAADPERYRVDAEALLALIASGEVTPPAPEMLPLDDAASAHVRIAGGGLKRRLVIDPWLGTGSAGAA